MLKRILNRFLGALPFSVVRHLSGEKLAAPFYHAVTDEPLPHIRHLFRARSLQAFEKDLDFFLKEFHPISLEDLLNHVRRGTPLPPNPLFLSVDDGLRENLRTVAPLCIRKGIPATFFVNPDFFRILGAQPAYGRLLDGNDQDRAALVSLPFAERNFGSAASALSNASASFRSRVSKPSVNQL